MPNEVTSLLNALNSYITCPVCKDINEVEIIPKCGHLICKNCKTKRTKCPVCFTELSAARLCSPSIKFIKELSKELLESSTGEVHRVEAKLGNSINTPNLKGEQITRSDSGTNCIGKISFGLKKGSEVSNDNVKIENEIRSKDNEINRFRSKGNNKKGINFYRNYSKYKEERKVYRNILKGFGIVGIDKKIAKFKSKNDLIAREKELQDQLNTIISRLNDRYSSNYKLEKPKFNYCSKMITDSDSSDSVGNIKMNCKTSNYFGSAKDGFSVIKCDLKRNHLSPNKAYCGLKRKNVDSSTEEGPSHKAFMKNNNTVKGGLESVTVNSSSPDKKLGSIVDEIEIVQRYLNSSMKGTEKEESEREIIPCNYDEIANKSFSLEEREFLNEGPSTTHKTIIFDKKSNRLSKSKIKEIISEYMEGIDPPEEDNLESDIMADMFHNVSNEIVVVGDTLCTAEKKEVYDKLINGSYDMCNSNSDSVKKIVDVWKETESNSGDSPTILVSSESEDNVEDLEKRSASNSSQAKPNHFNILLDDDMLNCRIVLKDLAPLILHPADNDMQMRKKECEVKSNIKKISCQRTRKIGQKNRNKRKMYMNAQKRKHGSNAVRVTQKLPKVSLEQKRNRFDEDSNNFEGFTEDDILILTVKLALFKMNCCKYSKNFSSSSLFVFDGKQILIKDVSQEESNPVSPCCPNKICKSLVTSSVQTESELLTITPGPSTSKLRPVSNVKLDGYEIENEKFMQNDVLDIRKTSPDTPPVKECTPSPLTQNGSVFKSTPVSRRQLSFMSPSFEKNLQYQDDGASSSNLKETEGVPNSPLNDNWQVLHNRMQYMIPSNSEDGLRNEFERASIKATRLTFTTCGLNSKETALVTKLAQMTKSCLSKDFTHDTTHLVIGAAGRGRLEYYLAIAYRAVIVTMDWVTLCLALNKILPVTGFIPTEDEGPLKCLEPNSLPFMGFHVASKILPTSSSYPISEVTKTLLSLGGARVLPNLDAFHMLQNVNYPRIFIYNSKSVLTPAVLEKCSSLHILPIQFMWVYESIGAFRAVPVMDFLDINVHSRTLTRDYRIPEQLACSRYPRLEGEFHPQILDERYQRSL